MCVRATDVRTEVRGCDAQLLEMLHYLYEHGNAICTQDRETTAAHTGIHSTLYINELVKNAAEFMSDGGCLQCPCACDCINNLRLGDQDAYVVCPNFFFRELTNVRGHARA